MPESSRCRGASRQQRRAPCPASPGLRPAGPAAACLMRGHALWRQQPAPAGACVPGAAEKGLTLPGVAAYTTSVALVAQPDRALASGAKGPAFESRRARHKKAKAWVMHPSLFLCLAPMRHIRPLHRSPCPKPRQARPAMADSGSRSRHGPRRQALLCKVKP